MRKKPQGRNQSDLMHSNSSGLSINKPEGRRQKSSLFSFARVSGFVRYNAEHHEHL